MPPRGLSQEKKDRIVALFREGMTAPQISRVVEGVTINRVYNVVRKARDADPTLPYRKYRAGERAEFRGRVVRIYLNAGVLRRVCAVAATRGIFIETLVERIIGVVAVDDIFEAVLDEAP